MFNTDFYPTPKDVISTMLDGVTIHDKIILEPSAGKGDIIDFLNEHGAKEVLFCEIEQDLQKISLNKGRFLKSNFLDLESDKISHVDLIVMNPPFSKDTEHILHAFDIAPAGCKIISLCNAQTFLNPYSMSRKDLKTKIDLYGGFQNLGCCFENAERSTNVEIGLITLQKSGADYKTEFEGFFLDEEEEPQGEGIITYNVVRDVVNRYVESIKIYDQQLETAVKLNEIRKNYFDNDYYENDRKSILSISISRDGVPIKRSEFKKNMQKSGWKFIFNKMNLQKYATKQLTEDINKFVEEQTHIPFTMRNIYKMLEIVVGTTSQRMDKAIEVVFDTVTQHYHENRYNVEGWKTNSHYLLNQRFILNGLCTGEEYGSKYNYVKTSFSGNFEKIEDFLKALCYITGDNYSDFISLNNFINNRYKLKTKDGKYINDPNYNFDVKISSYKYEVVANFKNEYFPDSIIEETFLEWGKWFEWSYFRVRAYKKGTMHFEFKDKEIWALFNQRIAKIKGFPLFEKAPDKRTERQKKKDSDKQYDKPNHNPTVLKTFKVPSF